MIRYMNKRLIAATDRSDGWRKEEHSNEERLMVKVKVGLFQQRPEPDAVAKRGALAVDAQLRSLFNGPAWDEKNIRH